MTANGKIKKSNMVHDIAIDLGVSESSVYNVINNSASVSDRLRRSVTECAKRLGYDIASASAQCRKDIFKIVAAIPSVPSSFWQNAVAGINDALKKYDLSGTDFRLIRYSKFRDEEETLRMIDIIAQMSPDACIAVPCASEKVAEKLSLLASSSLVGIIDEPLDIPGIFISSTGSYSSEGRKAAEIISDFPLERKKILLITVDGPAAERTVTFTEECSCMDSAEIVGNVMIEDYSRTFASDLSRKIAALKKDFNCVYMPSGVVGPVCLSLQKLGLKNSVYVVGHDASPSALEYFENGFKGAIIRQNIYGEAYTAVCAILDRLLCGEQKYPAKIEAGYSSELYF